MLHAVAAILAGRLYQTAALKVVVLQDFGAEGKKIDCSPYNHGEATAKLHLPVVNLSFYNHLFNVSITEQRHTAHFTLLQVPYDLSTLYF